MNLFLGTLLGNLFLGTLLGNLAWEPCLGTLLGNLFLETLLGNLFREPCVGTCSWEPCLGTLGSTDLAAPTCSEIFTMAEDPKLTLLGNKETN